MNEVDVILRLIVAAILGGMIGVERETSHKPAGLRTHVFVSMGSALFTLIAATGVAQFESAGASYNAAQIIGSILVGVGFIGGGVIMQDNHKVKGLTTAAGLWIASGIGIAVGMGLYILAVATVVLSLITLLGLERFKSEEVE